MRHSEILNHTLSEIHKVIRNYGRNGKAISTAFKCNLSTFDKYINRIVDKNKQLVTCDRLKLMPSEEAQALFPNYHRPLLENIVETNEPHTQEIFSREFVPKILQGKQCYVHNPQKPPADTHSLLRYFIQIAREFKELGRYSIDFKKELINEMYHIVLDEKDHQEWKKIKNEFYKWKQEKVNKRDATLKAFIKDLSQQRSLNEVKESFNNNLTTTAANLFPTPYLGQAPSIQSIMTFTQELIFNTAFMPSSFKLQISSASQVTFPDKSPMLDNVHSPREAESYSVASSEANASFSSNFTTTANSLPTPSLNQMHIPQSSNATSSSIERCRFFNKRANPSPIETYDPSICKKRGIEK